MGAVPTSDFDTPTWAAPEQGQPQQPQLISTRLTAEMSGAPRKTEKTPFFIRIMENFKTCVWQEASHHGQRAVFTSIRKSSDN